MLRVWDASLVRPTKDMDLLGRTGKAVENLVRIVQDACDQEVVADGLEFDRQSVSGALIKEDAEYNGVRVRFLGHLGKAEVTMQLDVGFGDAVVPPPVEVDVPTLLEFPPPRLRAYQPETSIAEKVHAMTVLGTMNGRMKDFYDIWLLSRKFRFEREVLRAAIQATFTARKTEIETTPIGLTPEFAREAQVRWSAFLSIAVPIERPRRPPAHVCADTQSRPRAALEDDRRVWLEFVPRAPRSPTLSTDGWDSPRHGPRRPLPPANAGRDRS
jgi:hypothetical protein